MASLGVEGSLANSTKEKQKQNEQQIREQKLNELDFIKSQVNFKNLLVSSQTTFILQFAFKLIISYDVSA
jgi:hypothetical protein